MGPACRPALVPLWQAIPQRPCATAAATHLTPLSHTHNPLPPASQDVAPREASVLFHMGKIYKKLDLLDEAMACFAGALDLQPPSADTNLIKSAVDKLRTPDDNEEEEI